MLRLSRKWDLIITLLLCFIGFTVSIIGYRSENKTGDILRGIGICFLIIVSYLDKKNNDFNRFRFTIHLVAIAMVLLSLLFL